MKVSTSIPLSLVPRVMTTRRGFIIATAWAMVYRWSVPRKVTRGSERAVWMPMPSLAQNCCRVIRPLLYSRTVLESPRNRVSLR